MTKKNISLLNGLKSRLRSQGFDEHHVERMRLPTDEQKEILRTMSQGADAWNKYVCDNGISSVDLSYIEMASYDEHGSRIAPLQQFQGFEFPEIDFTGAYFVENGIFGRSVFKGEASFKSAFFAAIDMSNVIFKKSVFFDGVKTGYANLFSHTNFEGAVSFLSAKFAERNAFNNCTFFDQVDFRNTIFRGGAVFDLCLFKKAVSFRNSEFERGQGVSFDATHFTSTVSFKGSKWTGLPNFANTKFQVSPASEDFVGLEEFLDKNSTSNYPVWKEKGASDCLRHLRTIAAISNDHIRESFYFSYEMKALGFKSKCHEKPLYFLYGFISDYGRSLSRPFLGLIAIYVFLYLITYLLVDPTCKSQQEDIASYTLGNMLPFLGAAYSSRSELGVECLDFGVYLTNFICGFFAFICLFLAGLALRNKFRL